MKKIVLAVVVLSSLSFSMEWLFAPVLKSTAHKEIRLEKEFHSLCKRYTEKSNQYTNIKLVDMDGIALHAVAYYDMKVKKYCKVKS